MRKIKTISTFRWNWYFRHVFLEVMIAHVQEQRKSNIWKERCAVVKLVSNSVFNPDNIYDFSILFTYHS